MLVKGALSVLICFISLVNGQSFSNCPMKETCEDCIQELDCVWCIETLTTNDVHCRPKNDTDNWCDPKNIYSPKFVYEEIQNVEFSEEDGNTIQMKPQRVKLSLRKGEKYDLQFRFKNAANYPVDLYYIMDLSKSMEAHKAKLAELGKKLSEAMRNITKNFQLGFGSFIDKVDLPFVSTVPAKLLSPCANCVSPYSFKNVLPLTTDYNKFVSEVISSQVSGNLDSPEGGLDAIMQAIVCKEDIKWRAQARHLLVFSTDAEYHIAGDGKLAGVIEPNPATCYKDDSEYLIYDYPSVSQINYVAKENNINIIFAIVKKQGSGIKNSYQTLSDNIENSKFGELDVKEDDNIINLIVENYQKIVQSVKFTSDASDEIDVQFSTNCNGVSGTDRCSNVHVGQILEFNATIQLRQCPQDGQTTKLLSIQPEALNERLIIELELQCDCPCSSKDDATYDMNSYRCSGMGDLACGVCNCSSGRFGRNCECDTSQSKSENVTLCIKEGTTDICSGSGSCKCGKCECDINPNNLNEKISGQFCECDNFSCKREGGLLCSGKGTCNCKKCDCFKGYSGESCDCDQSKTNCMAPNSDKVCSDNGNCICNHCECLKKNNNRYSGKYCEDCTSCPAQRCEELKPCVQCQVYKTGIYEKTCETKCTAFQTKVVTKLDDEGIDDIKKCRIPDNDTCIISFDYYYTDDNKLVVRALDKKTCPEPPNILAWILGVIATILVAGLIMLLIWKIFTTIHDRREYAKFENERQKLKWGANDNPLYKEATSTFANPAYNRNSGRYSFRKEQ